MALDTKYKRAALADLYLPGATSGGTVDPDAVVAALLATTISGTISFLEAQRAMLAATAGKPVFSNNDLALAFRDLDDAKDVIAVVLDADGNVTDLTFDLT